ncbi:MAG TPA: hypothetical protein PLU49_06225 [Saprospiraceae bacterium]|nr:hypothetical protein [Saprospiraceae bacterium]
MIKFPKGTPSGNNSASTYALKLVVFSPEDFGRTTKNPFLAEKYWILSLIIAKIHMKRL